jgi:Rrf2 family protein
MLVDLAEHKDDGFIALKDIAARQVISKKYLEQIVTILNHSNMLRTNRGYQGGYMLAQAPEKYTVGQILRITEGSLSPVTCMDEGPSRCGHRGSCKTLPIWQGLNKVMTGYLDSITLQDILNDYQARGADDYYI